MAACSLVVVQSKRAHQAMSAENPLERASSNHRQLQSHFSADTRLVSLLQHRQI